MKKRRLSDFKLVYFISFDKLITLFMTRYEGRKYVVYCDNAEL